jgi:NarL family two-component system response regulator LiaR
MSQTRPIRVMTVDDHEILHGGIEFFLLSCDDLELVGKARSGEEAIELCAQVQPDVVLMDMLMPGLDGIEATRAIRNQHPQVQVVALSSFHDPSLVQRALKAGAIGYLVKGITAVELADAIRSAHAGRPSLVKEAVEALVQAAGSSGIPVTDLSDREREVLTLVADGLSNTEIAQRLGISVSTVKYHVRGILAKLGASCRAEAVALALQLNLIIKST